jgi:hypothetical protein
MATDPLLTCRACFQILTEMEVALMDGATGDQLREIELRLVSALERAREAVGL